MKPVYSAFLLALAASLVFTPGVRALARRVGMIAKPRADRWHKKPTALLGGMAIFFSFLVSFLFYRVPGLAGAGLVVACASAMFLVGIVDDVVHLKPYAKLILQIAAATAVTTFQLQLPWTSSLVVNQALTVFWLVGVTNAMNLLDNIDGLATGIAVIASTFMAYFFAVQGLHGQAVISAAFAGACLGFLVFNFNPASIFMGDGGSLFIGFLLGALPLLQRSPHSRSLIAVLLPPVLVLAIPIIDTTLVTISRKLAGRPVSQGGRDHVSHRLVALGLSERAATLTLYALAVVSGLTGVMAYQYPASVVVAFLPWILLAILFMAIYLGRVKVYGPVTDPKESNGRALLPTLAAFSHKRRIFEVLNDFLLVVIAYYSAFFLRFEGRFLEPHWHKFQRSLPLVIVVQLSIFLMTGLYRGLWQYTSISDLRRFVTSCSLAWLGSIAAIWLAFGSLDGFSRAAFIVDGLLLFMGVAATRVSFRLIQASVASRVTRKHGKRVIIYGAGDGGELLVREIQNNQDLGLIAIGFVDDDPRKVGKVIHGVRILGTSERLGDLLPELQVQEVVVSSTKLDATRLTALTTVCESHQVSFRRARIFLE